MYQRNAPNKLQYVFNNIKKTKKEKCTKYLTLLNQSNLFAHHPHYHQKPNQYTDFFFLIVILINKHIIGTNSKRKRKRRIFNLSFNEMGDLKW